MLSRNPESTQMISSRTKGPNQFAGSSRGSTSGTPLSSKCRARSAKPTSRHNRLASSTHSCAMWAASPGNPSPALKPVTITL
ncbi:MAG: hypothetical protein AW07_04249 [Candidatus Accumulibacter sp. SK-11]|nr:MAG: hypothetical protein AW07_04249 [Candidatus Accumulibacter sp. SK-11]